MSLADAAANGHIQVHKTSADEVRSLRALIERDIADAAIEQLSDDRRFATAYNAALQISKLVLAHSGYRVSKGQSAHFTSFEMAAVAIPTTEMELTEYLMCAAENVTTSITTARRSSAEAKLRNSSRKSIGTTQ